MMRFNIKHWLPTTRLPLVAWGLLLLMFSQAGLVTAQGAPDRPLLNLPIYDVVDTDYPELEVRFSLHDLRNGRAVNGASANLFDATYNGQTAEVLSVEQVLGTGRPVHLVLGFDLTGSVVNSTFSPGRNYLDVQREIALQLIDQLDTNDLVAVTTFDALAARVVTDLTNDHGAARNAIVGLEVDTNPRGNIFLEGMEQAVNALNPGAATNPVPRRVVVVMTDVGRPGDDPPGGDSSFAETAGRATELNAPIFTIGFNGADVSFLQDLFSGPTGGFTFELLEEAGDPGIANIVDRIQGIITSEYVMRLEATAPANNQTAPLIVRAQIDVAETLETFEGVRANTSPIVVTFSDELSAPDNPLVVDDEGQVTLVPEIRYADTGERPVLASATYSFAVGGITTPLTVEDLQNPTTTWDVAGAPSGDYEIQLTVSDAVSNTGTGTAFVRVAGPAQVDIVAPIVPPDSENNRALIAAEPLNVQLRVTSEFNVTTNGIEFFVNNEAVELDPAPTITTADVPGQFNVNFTWDAAPLRGRDANLRVLVTDIEGNSATDTVATRIDPAIPLRPFLIALAIALLLLFLLAIVLRLLRGSRRNTASSAANFQAGGNAVPNLPEAGFNPLPNIPDSQFPPPEDADSYEPADSLIGRLREPEVDDEDLDDAFGQPSRRTGSRNGDRRPAPRPKPNSTPTDGPYVEVWLTEDPKDVIYVTLPLDSTATVGRRKGNTVRLPNVRGASRFHGSIQPQGNRFVYRNVFENKESENREPTYVNGQPLPMFEPYTLRDGDELQMGDAVLRFVVPKRVRR